MDRIWDLMRFGERKAMLTEDGLSLSYEDLSLACENLTAVMEKRSLVFCLCHNSVGSVVGYVAFLNHGHVPLMVNAYIDEELLHNLLLVYRPAYLWLPKEQISRWQNFTTVYETFGYALLKTNDEQNYPLHDDLALLLTTSGSTGSPKFVRQSYTNIRENIASIVEYLELSETERPITTLPMQYTYGLSIINTHLSVGATILLTDKTIMQKDFWQFMKESEATSLAGVPYTYEMLDKLRFYRMKLPHLRTLTQAGGKLTSVLQLKFARWAKETGKKFVVMYGAAEATARMGYLPSSMAIEKPGSMGIAIPGGEFKLVDDAGKAIVAPDTAGELVYTGKNVTMGYAECASDLAKGDERGSVLSTGDIAMRDEAGYYYIVGRKKRFLKVYGNRVNLDEMERLIKSSFSLDVAVAGVDDHVYVFITDKSRTDDVKSFAVEKTKLNPTAFHVVLLDDIPHNESGKTLYKDLEPYYEK